MVVGRVDSFALFTACVSEEKSFDRFGSGVMLPPVTLPRNLQDKAR